MATNEHLVVKPQKIVDTGIGILEQELVIPNTFQKEGLDQFKGAEDDTVTVKIPGVLPFHDYEWRSGSARSTTPGVRAGIVFDQYSERKVPVTFGGNVYSAVKATDEQMDFDIDQWATLLTPQVKAVARGLGRRAVNVLKNASYNVTIGAAEGRLRAAIIEARRVLNAFRVPDEERLLLVGSDFESALLNDEKMNLAQNAGDGIAESALTNATIGKRFGFTIVVDQTIQPDAAYAYVRSAFIFLSGAPSVPASVPFGATQSFEGIAMRWVRDYDSEHMQDRSVVNTYAGFRSVKDVLVGWDEAHNTEVVSDDEFFVRGIKMTLGGSSVYPEADSDLATLTGVSETNAFAADES